MKQLKARILVSYLSYKASKKLGHRFYPSAKFALEVLFFQEKNEAI